MAANTSSQEHHEEHAHATVRDYVNIAAILSAVTAFEVALYFIEGIGHTSLVGMLLILMVVKFSIVVGWYMHLKYDHRYFTLIFVGGLFVAVSIVIALAALFGVFTGGEEIIRQLPESH